MKPQAAIPPFALIALRAAIDQAQQYVGATAPNPPVGAAAIDHQGRILSVQAHERAGTGHAEAKVIEDLRNRGLLSEVETLVVTLEPCNHHGRTPPCTEAILNAGIRRVLYGVADPNPRVAGQGAKRLRDAGLEVWECEVQLNDPLRIACQELIQPFAHWARTGYPWVVIKTAHLADGSMVPPPGLKTFTSSESLRLAHELRKRADAILTGSGTVLADHPEFTVRHVPDHEIVTHGLKKRKLVVLDRRNRISQECPEWLESAKNRGFDVWLKSQKPKPANLGCAREITIEATLRELGQSGVLEVLVEAGPELSSAILQTRLWNQHVLITQGNPGEAKPDSVKTEQNVHWNHPKSGQGHPN